MRNLFKQYLLKKSNELRDSAVFWYTHYPVGTLGSEKGKMCMALSNLYMSLANLL